MPAGARQEAEEKGRLQCHVAWAGPHATAPPATHPSDPRVPLPLHTPDPCHFEPGLRPRPLCPPGGLLCIGAAPLSSGRTSHEGRASIGESAGGPWARQYAAAVDCLRPVVRGLLFFHHVQKHTYRTDMSRSLGAPPAVASRRVDLPGSPLSAPPHSGLRRARGGPHLAPARVRPRRPRPARRPRGSRMPHRAAGRPGPLGAWRARPREPLTLAGKRGRSSCFYKFAHHRATTSHGQEASCGGVTWKSKGRPGAARGTTLKPTELSICI